MDHERGRRRDGFKGTAWAVAFGLVVIVGGLVLSALLAAVLG